MSKQRRIPGLPFDIEDPETETWPSVIDAMTDHGVSQVAVELDRIIGAGEATPEHNRLREMIGHGAAYRGTRDLVQDARKKVVPLAGHRVGARGGAARERSADVPRRCTPSRAVAEKWGRGWGHSARRPPSR